MEKKNLSQKIKIIIGFNGVPISENIYAQYPIQIGRDVTNDLVLDYGFISRKHCEVIEDQGKFHLLDLKSRNGIYVDGKLGRIFEISDKLEFQVNVVSIQILVVDELKLAEEKRIEENRKKIEATRPTSTAFQSRPIQPERTVVQVASQQNLSADIKHEYRPLITGDLKSDLIGFHPKVRMAIDKKVEAIVVWHDQIIQVREFEENEQITLGPSPSADIQVPMLPTTWRLADVQFAESVYHVYKGLNFSLSNDGLTWSDYKSQHATAQSYKLTAGGMVRFQLAPWLKIYLRYIPSQHRLTRKKLREPEKDFRDALVGSLMVHFGFMFLLAFTVPKIKPASRVKMAQERFARVIVPPKPIFIEPPKVVVQEPLPKEIEIPKPVVQEPALKVKKEKPKPVVIEKRKTIQKPVVQKKPVEKLIQKVAKNETTVKPIKNHPPVEKSVAVTKPVPIPPKPAVKVESLGALAALGLGGGNPSAKAEAPNINIESNNNSSAAGTNKNASMNSVVSSLPSATGKLSAGGGGPIRTKGNGSGVGTGYGTQGLSSGGAGSRGIAGKVVGQPKLSFGSGVTEGLSRQQVMAVVQQHSAEIQRCYEKLLLLNPDLSGRMEFDWDISAAGKVADVRIKKSAVKGGDGLGECVKGVFRKMSFPTAKNGQSTTPNVGFPFGRL